MSVAKKLDGDGVAKDAPYDIKALRAELAEARQSAPSVERRAYGLYVSGEVKLPPVPKVALLLMPLLRRPDTQLKRCVELMEMDLALVSAMLRCANSAAYFRGNQVTGISEAVMRIGLREAACLALSLSTRALYDERIQEAMKFVAADRDAEWKKSVIAAHAAREISRRLGRGEEDMCYATALFQSVGHALSTYVLAMLALQSAEVAMLPVRERQATAQRMRSVLMGEYMLREGLPTELCQLSVEIGRTDGSESTATCEVVRLTLGLVASLLGSGNDSALYLDRAFTAARNLQIDRAGLDVVKKIILEARDGVDSLGVA